MNSRDITEIIREVKWKHFLALEGKAASLFTRYLTENADEIRQYIINKLCADLEESIDDEIKSIEERRSWLKERE